METVSRNKTIDEVQKESPLFTESVNNQRENVLYNQLKSLEINHNSKFKGSILDSLNRDLEMINIRFKNMSFFARLFKLPPYSELKQEKDIVEEKIRVWKKYENLN